MTAAPPGRCWAAGLVLAGATLLTVQGGLVRIALPVIRAELDTGVSGIQAIGLAALAAITATLVAFGRLADLAGPRRVHAAGLVGFAAGGTASAAAPTAGWLVAALAVQGLGWSMTVASGTTLLVHAFPTEQRGRILAARHSAIAVGLAAGPAGGGLVVDTLGWRWGLGMLAAAGLVLAALALARLPDAGRPHPPPRFDLAGSALLAAALLGLLVLIERGGALSVPATVAFAVATAATLAAFTAIELRTSEPVVDLGLFARRDFSAGLAASFLNFVAMAAHMFLLPFVLQEHLGYTAGQAGAVMVTAPVVILVTAPLAGKLADLAGPRLPATAGLALITAAVALMSGFRPATPPWGLLVVLAVYGLGAALFQAPNLTGVLDATPSDRVGVASGTQATLGRLGQVAGIAVAGTAWQAGLDRHGPDALGAAFRDSFLTLAAFGALATAASWLRGAPTGASPPARDQADRC